MMRNVRYVFESVALALLMLVFRLMPVDYASACGGWIGRVIGLRLGVSRKAIRHLQAAFPDKPQHEIDGIVRDMWDNLGRVLAEYPHLRFIAQHRVTFHGGDVIDDLTARKQGAIFVSGHLANWEVGAAALYVQYGLQVNAMYRALNNPYADQLLAHFRTLGGRIPVLSKSRTGGQGAMRALKAKETVGILIDQKYNQGLSIPFFGMQAMTNPVAPKFSRKFDVPIMPYFIKRTKGAQFEIHCKPPLTITDDQDDAAILTILNGLLENWITDHPAQWLWLHNRWKAEAF